MVTGLSAPLEPPPRVPVIRMALQKVGTETVSAIDDLKALLEVLGQVVVAVGRVVTLSSPFRFAAVVTQLDRMAFRAMPIIALITFLIGAIICQQGFFFFRKFGADTYVVDLVSVLTLREIGVLIVSIMVAGRTGSAFTAEIGSMKMREEIDALTVIGLNPVGVLVFPRLVALVIALPCLTIAANFASLGGAIFVSWFYSDITPAAFIDRLRSAIDVSTIFAGLIKAPFMAMIIGIIGSVEGMKVGGSAESLGQHVTASVVKSIFVVVILDGMFAIFFAAIDF